LLAAIQHSGGRRIDCLIASIAGQLKRQGLRVGGVVQSNVEQAGECRCDMRLEELTTGRVVSISQRLGPQSRGCRLNDVALEQIVALVEASLVDGLDILILNKFGRQEAEGKGLRTAVAHAVAAGIPVLVHASPFRAAHCGKRSSSPRRPAEFALRGTAASEAGKPPKICSLAHCPFNWNRVRPAARPHTSRRPFGAPQHEGTGLGASC
jgi:nucleoside-triphosphatase THEP1